MGNGDMLASYLNGSATGKAWVVTEPGNDFLHSTELTLYNTPAFSNVAWAVRQPELGGGNIQRPAACHFACHARCTRIKIAFQQQPLLDGLSGMREKANKATHGLQQPGFENHNRLVGKRLAAGSRSLPPGCHMKPAVQGCS